MSNNDLAVLQDLSVNGQGHVKPEALRDGILASQVARRHADKYCQGTLGYKAANMHFELGHIELLDRVGIPDESVDIVISNCVINLSPDKPRVLQQVRHFSCIQVNTCSSQGSCALGVCSIWSLLFWNFHQQTLVNSAVFWQAV